MSQEIWAYELYYDKQNVPECVIDCTSFKEEYFEEYKRIYNECFYDMRRALDIIPYNWYSQYSQMVGRTEEIFLLLEECRIIGSVACYGNEIDDLIVEKSHQNQGYGKQLLLWATNRIRQRSSLEITLHVAEWNRGHYICTKASGLWF
ncbi:MAG: GNAT family N-acetyltransferase [Blautia sp.]|nr:GNAT family N-acetyltransferase [Blautia sp.]